jgi:hypothetical protein
MNEAQRQRDIEDHIDRDIQFACGTGVGLIALRLFGVGVLLWMAGFKALGSRATAQVAIEIVLVGLFTYGTYHRRMWGPIGQLALWAVTFFTGWYLRHSLVPPLGILGLIVWYGYYCGLRGVRDAQAQRQARERAALTPAS